MAGNGRFESSSVGSEELAFSGSYTNGQRSNHSSANLDRSGSFLEVESRMLNSGATTPRSSSSSMGDLPLLPQCLTLEPITIENQKCIRLGDLRRALGILSYGSSAEDNLFGAAHAKPSPIVAIEELRRFKASLSGTVSKARGRVKRLDECLRKLNKYCEALSLKKQQRSEMMVSERSSGLNLLKIGSQFPRNPVDHANQRVEEKTKNAVLSKRVRSSVAEIKAESRTNTLSRQPMVSGKDRDILRDGGEGSDFVEEKIRRLPAGGETWDRKMKRKRSVGPTPSRSADDGEPRRVMHHKINNDLTSQSCDAQNYRSASSNRTGDINKLDGTFLHSSNGRTVLKNVDKVPLSRGSMAGMNKERLKGSNKLNGREEGQILDQNLLIKGKASRAPRSGPVMAGNSSPNFPRSSGPLECWEPPVSVNKTFSVSGANNHKRPMPAGPSSPPMAQWVGQRPQKISRTRRANLVSPVSNHDEVQMSLEGSSPCNVGGRSTTFGTNGSLLGRGVCNAAQQYKVKNENISSPARLSESDESGAGENHEARLKEKGPGIAQLDDKAENVIQNSVPSPFLMKKSKIIIRGETGDSGRRQGRSGRVSSLSRTSVSPLKEKLENSASVKPLKSTRLVSERNSSCFSKSGRPPLKKLSDRKGVTRVGNVSSIGSPDLSGEPDDDHEELLTTASFACNANYLACSSLFWKKMQPVFAHVSSENASYLLEQGDLVLEISQALVSGEEKATQDQVLDINVLSGRLDLERRKKVPPLYQRVLSALIFENEFGEFEENSGGNMMSIQYNGEYSPDLPHFSIDAGPRNMAGVEFECDSIFGQPLKQYLADRISCNGGSTFIKGTGMHNQSFNNGSLKGDLGVVHSDFGNSIEFSENGSDGPSSTCTDASDCSYEQMCLEDRILLELQGVGIYPEIVPDLADGEDDAIDRDILGMQKGLSQQVGQTKMQLNKLIKALEDSSEIEKWGREQVAMDRLVELAYRKLMATRGSIASKYRIAKVPKQVAISFMKRTLARCRKFEVAGKSCFSEPTLRDVIFGAPPCINDKGLLNLPPEIRNSQAEPRLSGMSSWMELHGLGTDQDLGKTGPILNREKRELLLDDVTLKATPSLGNSLLGGAKGKRSERDKDAAARNSGAKSGRLYLGNNKGERKTKPKPKQKTAQLSTSGNRSTNNDYPLSTGFGENAGHPSNRKGELGEISNGFVVDPSTENKEHMDFANLPLELDSIELGEPQDLGSWLNIEDDGLQEEDHDILGLDIPMDDLSELNMNW